MTLLAERTVGLVAESSPDYVARVFACWARGEAVVPLRKRDDAQRMERAGVTEVVVPSPGAGWLGARHAPRDDAAVAQVLFTSGTEGEPKGVVLTHANLADVVARLNAVMQVTADIREYVGVPVVHSFGFGRCRAVTAAGGKAYLPARGFNPVEINAMLEAGDINAISAVPSLWRVLLDADVVSARAAARVRWIEIGSQSMSVEEKERLRALFPAARIVQHYGLTEASRTTFLEVHEGQHLDTVGRATGAVEVKLAPDGRIAIRGPHVAARMIVAGELVDPRDADGWLVTNDLGALVPAAGSAQGPWVRFLGRADDVINCGGLKLSPEAIEAGVRAVLGLDASGTRGEIAVARVPNAARGDGILVVATPAVTASDAQLVDAAVQAASALGVSAGGATHALRLEALPRTDNGKLKRKELTAAYAALAQPAPPVARAAAGDGDLRAALGAILGKTPKDDDTFVQLGGDSLRFIQATVALEKRLGRVPEGWERRTFKELEALTPAARGGATLEPSVLLRALAIVSVVVNHSDLVTGVLNIAGAAYMLLLPAGHSFARFQLQRVLATGQARHALAALPRVLLPAVLVLLVQQLRGRAFDPAPLLLVHNWINAPGVFSYWFLEVYAQLHVFLAAVLLLPPVRGALRDRPWPTMVAAVVVSALVFLVVPRVWSADHLYNRVPYLALWYFALGALIYVAKTPAQRAVASLFVVGLAAAQLTGMSGALWVIAGGLFLIWAPTVRVPVLVARGVSALASASLYIYVAHVLVFEPFARVFPWAGNLGKVAAGLGAGVVLWLAFEQGWALVGRLRRR